eukprot:GHVS01004331.1.p1 GENE.GHVS01004331.1~~GHVS01004331.1.p1  ORF type:complete len:360 (-),score=27.13 GHVS01004331.1:203-1282(-)
MAKLRIGKMKLLAAGPPLLFLALYSLSFIDLSLSPITPEEQIEALGQAKEALKNAVDLRVTLNGISVMKQLLNYMKAYQNVDSTKHAEEYATKLVQEALVDFDVKVTDLKYMDDAGTFKAKLVCGSEYTDVLMLDEHPRLDKSQLQSSLNNFNNKLSTNIDIFSSASLALPYFRALGNNPEVVTVNMTLKPWKFEKLFRAKISSTSNVAIGWSENDKTFFLKRPLTVQFRDAKNKKVLCNLEITRTAQYPSKDFPSLSTYFIWDSLRSKWKACINMYFFDRGDNRDNSLFRRLRETIVVVQMFDEIRVTTKVESAETNSDGSVTIGAITTFVGLGPTDANKGNADLRVVHYRTFTDIIP